LKQKGKQIRPLFVLLSAKCHGEINENTYRAAAFIELLHTATLIHDDVVDNSDKRRGMFSLNALWKNKIAVLIGDYLLSKGMLLALQNKDYQMLDTISETVKAMSEGEIYQMEKARRMDITEEDYYDIIRGKTASLISSCCVVGALSVNATESQVEKMRKFGTSAGIAFQIKDDIFDYQINNKIQIACSLLTHTKKSISEISEFIGYQNPHYFTSMFKTKVGITPTQYRKKVQ
jgi:octaprenyl-diphosphate synthase